MVKMLLGGALGLSPTLMEIIGWHYGANLTSIQFTCRDDVWTAIIKADFGNDAMVAFLDVGDFARCIEVTIEFIEEELLKWHKDKYPPPRKRRGRIRHVNVRKHIGGE